MIVACESHFVPAAADPLKENQLRIRSVPTLQIGNGTRTGYLVMPSDAQSISRTLERAVGQDMIPFRTLSDVYGATFPIEQYWSSGMMRYSHLQRSPFQVTLCGLPLLFIQIAVQVGMLQPSLIPLLFEVSQSLLRRGESVIIGPSWLDRMVIRKQ